MFNLKGCEVYDYPGLLRPGDLYFSIGRHHLVDRDGHAGGYIHAGPNIIDLNLVLSVSIAIDQIHAGDYLIENIRLGLGRNELVKHHYRSRKLVNTIMVVVSKGQGSNDRS